MHISVASLIVWIVAVVVPLILYRLAEPTPLRVLFRRPCAFKRATRVSPA